MSEKTSRRTNGGKNGTFLMTGFYRTEVLLSLLRTCFAYVYYTLVYGVRVALLSITEWISGVHTNVNVRWGRLYHRKGERQNMSEKLLNTVMRF